MAANIGKNTSPAPTDTKKSIDSLKQEYNEAISKIRKVLGGQKDRDKLSIEDKNELRTLYMKASGCAKTLADRITDEKESEEFRNNHKKLSEKAASYGSAIKNITPKTTFDDVKGLENVKKLVKSFMFLAQNPDVLKAYKLEGGLGMLMYGAPGTGKTMFAEAIANAMNLPLFIVTPADIFKSYVGESEQSVRLLFQELNNCPDGAVLFVDECESIFSKRGQDTKDYKAAVTTELLQAINGFGGDGTKRIMIAATNRPDVIDPAYLRYKRFSHLIHVTPPDSDALEAIIGSKLADLPLDNVTVKDVLALAKKYTTKVVGSSGLDKVTKEFAHYSAADICGIIEEACRLAIEKMQEKGTTVPEKVTMAMFEQAFKKIPPSISAELLAEYESFRNNQ